MIITHPQFKGHIIQWKKTRNSLKHYFRQVRMRKCKDLIALSKLHMYQNTDYLNMQQHCQWYSDVTYTLTTINLYWHFNLQWWKVFSFGSKCWVQGLIEGQKFKLRKREGWLEWNLLKMWRLYRGQYTKAQHFFIYWWHANNKLIYILVESTLQNPLWKHTAKVNCWTRKLTLNHWKRRRQKASKHERRERNKF